MAKRSQEAPFPLLGNVSVKSVVEVAHKQRARVAEEAQCRATTEQRLNEFNTRKDRYSPETLRRLESAWGCFVGWCVSHQCHSLPASPDTVEAFFVSRSTDLHRNTLSVYKWAISRIHRVAGCPDPCVDVFVGDRLKAIARTKAKEGEFITQASPFNEQHLTKLMSVWGESDKVLVRRNLAMLAVAYESMLRGAELANIRVSDLAFEDDGTIMLTIPITKTNHSGEPDACVLSHDVAELILDYAEMGNLDLSGEGYLFVGVSKYNVCMHPKANEDTGKLEHVPITTKTIRRVFNQAWEDLDLARRGGKPFTAHSARVGATQDLLRKGYSTLQIQQSGRWSSDVMVTRYGRGILARDGAMVLARKKS
ncbi:tyrosine-type recombinase/integrase [Vibrio sp. Of7-15]|uniref:tyrosine-type recombinase/integrase n=1 Tax=Vibrio sp. Of7-15 TaxID=2724879 RepID=UPI001EF1D049|nr:tyrosine-type recombinase/integrase [Vibrio sp. Of7-15]MCG7500117.1 tyrosine-type recombinase/integrase [Vibrio sp. Of7-15]